MFIIIAFSLAIIYYFLKLKHINDYEFIILSLVLLFILIYVLYSPNYEEFSNEMTTDYSVYTIYKKYKKQLDDYIPQEKLISYKNSLNKYRNNLVNAKNYITQKYMKKFLS